jgi:hypothetical protein
MNRDGSAKRVLSNKIDQSIARPTAGGRLKGLAHYGITTSRGTPGRAPRARRRAFKVVTKIWDPKYECLLGRRVLHVSRDGWR